MATPKTSSKEIEVIRKLYEEIRELKKYVKVLEKKLKIEKKDGRKIPCPRCEDGELEELDGGPYIITVCNMCSNRNAKKKKNDKKKNI